LTPEYILSTWSREKLNLMTAKYIERHTVKHEENQTVSDSELLQQMGIEIQKG
jgi:hypothetical protein